MKLSMRSSHHWSPPISFLLHNKFLPPRFNIKFSTNDPVNTWKSSTIHSSIFQLSQHLWQDPITTNSTEIVCDSKGEAVGRLVQDRWYASKGNGTAIFAIFGPISRTTSNICSKRSEYYWNKASRNTRNNRCAPTPAMQGS